MNKPTVILFGRVPQYGVGKRRLAAGIGNLKAWQFYRQNVKRSLRCLKDPRWTLKFAGTPEKFSASVRDVAFVKQGQGDLGDRLLRTYRAHKGPVLIIGTDVPDLKPVDISVALNELKKGSAVLGKGKAPFDDGGFWCLGLRVRSNLSSRVFKSVPWSHETTADETSKALRSVGFKIVQTTQHNDVDDKNTYEAWRLASKCKFI